MSPQTQIDTLILSDMHLGSPVGKARQVASLLKRYSFKRLILLGDIIDNSAFDHFDQESADLLDLLKELSSPKSGHKVIWIAGNHDRSMQETVNWLIGAPIREQYVWEYGHKRFLAIHGDQFDGFIENNSRTNDMAHFFFLFLQRLDRNGRHIIKYTDLSNNFLRRISKKVATGAITYAKEHQIDTIICGHTHVPMQKIDNEGSRPVHYVNVGCWTHTPSSYATIDDKGNVSLETFS